MENLKEMRENKGLSQIEVAKLIGVSANTYRNWEYGANYPSEENMKKLKEVLGDKDDIQRRIYHTSRGDNHARG